MSRNCSFNDFHETKFMKKIFSAPFDAKILIIPNNFRKIF